MINWPGAANDQIWRWTISIIYLIRHGETDWNLDKKIQGQTDIPLNEQGRRQAEALAVRLASIPLNVIYTSDLGRARETAEIIAAKQSHVVNLSITPDIRECHYGLWEGLTRGEVACRFPEDWSDWIRGGEIGCPTCGEDFLLLARRAGRIFDAAAQEGTTVLISTHRGPLRAILCHALGLDLSLLNRFFVANCSLSALECYPDSQRHLILLNDTCHLRGIPGTAII
jgi:broad specificity phosphatase PhoE